MQRPTATRVLARLEELGLVDRAAGPGGPPLVAHHRERGRAHAAAPPALAQERSSSRAASPRLEPDELATLDRAAAILERLLDEEGRR